MPTCKCGNKMKFIGYEKGYRIYKCELCQWEEEKPKSVSYRFQSRFKRN
jgi:hypothetical protein